ncbi:hypothetical protein LUZ60_013013 [Juncus effusus]|nr:hypothetical protein LUZ60_013013 [Juncus effusus]
MGSSHQAAIEAASQRVFNSNNHVDQSNQVRNEEEKERKQNGHVAVPVDVPVQVQVQQGELQKQGQSQGQSAGAVVCWERFLPVKTLRVLLVENDDSTRHVVSALLRNCGYEVVTCANGLQAWKILEDLKNHIDLVLTEVVMPCLSGIGLLTKIMSHKTRKTIPVIMMSSNDSMGTVFKCLSKGAVDFLVKPIRKNELKNLWQHIWRRCHSSSGSGSESGIQTQKGNKLLKSGDDSDNNSRSTDNEENTSIGLNARDSSDNGSGTQSSWTKCAVEVESPKALSLTGQLADPPDSTCAQVIHPKPEIYCNTWLPISTPPSHLPPKQPNDEFMGKDLEIGVPGNLVSNNPKETEQAGEMLRREDKEPSSSPKPEGMMPGGSARLDEPSSQAADLIGSITKDQQSKPDVPNGFALKMSEPKDLDKFTVLPSLELSLKRLRSALDSGPGSSEDRNVVRRSDQSAFTRYHTTMNSSAASNQVMPAGGYGYSCSPTENNNHNNNNNNNNSSENQVVKTDLANNVKSNSNDNVTLIKQGSNGSSNNNDMGSTNKNVYTARAGPSKEKVGSPSAVKTNQHHTSAFHPVQFRPNSTPPSTAPAPQTPQDLKSKDASKMDGQDQLRETEIQVQHHHHHHYHHHHHHHSTQQQEQEEQQQQQLQQVKQPSVDQNAGVEITGVTGAPPVTRYSNRMEGQAANYSINGSNSGSNHGSNGQNGASTGGHGGSGAGANVENRNGAAEKSGAVNGNESGSGVYQHRAAQREAALNKFRQKRKERNFGKKVRYQSRKRLAEQRPRVRGQFVRQAGKGEASER